MERQKLLRVGGRSVAWVPPLLLLVAIAVADYNTTGEFRIISWIVLVPGIAAALCGVWGTAVFAVLSMAAYTVVDSAWPHQFQAGLPDFILVALGGVLATLACVVRVRGERRALHMRDVTDTVRRTVLRPLPPGWGGLEHAGVYLTADAQARVGGDFYDIQPGPHGTRVFVGDVQGKVLARWRRRRCCSARSARRVSTRRTWRWSPTGWRRGWCATVSTRPRSAARTAAGSPRRCCSRSPRTRTTPSTPSSSVTSPAGGERVGGGGCRWPGLPLGYRDLTPNAPPVRRVRLDLDETLLVVTDGVTEARDREGHFFQVAEEVRRAVAADPGLMAPDRLVLVVRDGTLRHCRGIWRTTPRCSRCGAAGARGRTPRRGRSPL
ncbi:SpoIIE family protein phosphatase [Streptomyces thermocarboxydus]